MISTVKKKEKNTRFSLRELLFDNFSSKKNEYDLFYAKFSFNDIL